MGFAVPVSEPTVEEAVFGRFFLSGSIRRNIGDLSKGGEGKRTA